MAGWTIDWSAPGAADWAVRANLNDFIRAFNERALAGGWTDLVLPEFSVGDDAQAIRHDGIYIWLNAIQSGIGAMAQYDGGSGNFARSRDTDGTERPTDCFDGETTRDISQWYYQDLADLLSRAFGEARTQWRGGSGVDGKVAGGDDLDNPAIWEDIQMALNALTWTIPAPPDWTPDGTDNCRYGIHWGDYEPDYSWEEAKAEAEDGWETNLYQEDVAPTEYTTGYQLATEVDYNASMTSCSAYGALRTGHLDAQCAVDWYVWAETPTGDVEVFDANGETVEEDTWRLWLSDPGQAGNADITSSSLLGDTAAKPAWCDAPASDQYVVKGWTATDKAAVVRWNVAGGFEYG